MLIAQNEQTCKISKISKKITIKIADKPAKKPDHLCKLTVDLDQFKLILNIDFNCGFYSNLWGSYPIVSFRLKRRHVKFLCD
jgi:hypothetical protein